MNEALYRAAENRLWASHDAIPTEHRLRLARNDVAVRVQEVGVGPPVLFVHGANTSGASWVALAARLQDFRCLILDRPGTVSASRYGSELTHSGWHASVTRWSSTCSTRSVWTGRPS